MDKTGDHGMFGRGLEDMLEIQRRLNELNEVMMHYLGLAFTRLNPDEEVEWPTVVVEDALDAEEVG